MSELFLEVDHFQFRKDGQGMNGDAFTSVKDEERLVCVLADGLGSGVKAGVLATLTTTMAARFILEDMDIRRAAEVILETLPVCSKRKIGYSTFTIVDAQHNGAVRIIEYDNPSFILLRHGEVQQVEMTEIQLQDGRGGRLRYASLRLQPEDRVVFFSDGVTQSGMGSSMFPLGWGESGVEAFLQRQVTRDTRQSASDVCQKVCRRALELDRGKALDDITCASLYLREPRRLLLLTGPPYDRARDPELAGIVRAYTGRRVICGGATSSIIARELGLPISVNLEEVKRGFDAPPTASMEGFDLVTEGTITLSRCLRGLEDDAELATMRPGPVRTLLQLLHDSDIVDFVVGSRINEAHQDPTLPRELEIRRNLVRRFRNVLEKKYMKETTAVFL